MADTILPGFDGDLQQGAKERFTRASVEIKTETHITRVEAKGIEVKELGFVPLGMLAWSTGLAPWLLLKNGIDHAKQDEKTSKYALSPATLSRSS